MIKKHKRHQDVRKSYRVNERISALELRVLDKDGKQIGIMSKYDALREARDLELDLVEIAPLAKPPVVRLINFNKFLYQEEKKKQEEKRKAKVSETKELRLGPFMSENDLQVMIRRGREFLENGDKVRLVVRFRGRQITRPEFGRGILTKAIESLNDISKIDREAHFEGRQLIALLSPERKKTPVLTKEEETHAEEKNQKVSSEEI